MEEPKKVNSIKSWSADDRPREKMLLKGVHALSDAELIAILIGSGTKEMSAVSLAKNILLSAEHNLDELGKKSIKELIKHKGIGEAKAITIAAALEIGKRRQMSNPIHRIRITSSKDANLELHFLKDLPHEEFWMMMLNRNSRLIGKIKLFSGGVSGTFVDVKMVIRTALDHLATSIVIAHNHPSGNLKPSQQDIAITTKIKEASKTLDIILMDHLIISSDGYYSFADEGLL